MDFSAKIICDSLAPCGKRLTTLECTYPRFIHAEILTHRMLSRNSASSRAIPWERFVNGKDLHPKCMKYMILNNPVVPIHWGKEQKGMQSADEELDGPIKQEAIREWLITRDFAVIQADMLHKKGLHKSLINRITEPWMWITIVVSSTEWANFFALRCHPAAERHFQKIAGMMKDAIDKSEPTRLEFGQWHLPYINAEELLYIGPSNIENLKKISAGRCARVSYLTHDGQRDIMEDIKLCERLTASTPIHASPLEHVAMALDEPKFIGNFCGFKQFRKEFPNENIT